MVVTVLMCPLFNYFWHTILTAMFKGMQK